jgi:hypothetical protein
VGALCGTPAGGADQRIILAMIGEDETATVLCVLYDDPLDGYPRSYARHDVPTIERYPGGQTTPTPKQLDF